MLRKVYGITSLASLCLITAMAFLSSTARADMGMIPIGPIGAVGSTSEVSVYEPGQKAIIAWNDGKEIMILSTDVNASEETKAMRILPLPSEPTIQTGSFKSFEAAQRLIDEHAPRVEIESRSTPTSWGSSVSEAQGAEAQGVEILFHRRMGAHEITAVKANDYSEFIKWAKDFIGEAEMSWPQRLESIADHYISNGIRYFVFDAVNIAEEKQSVDPLVYKFETDYLYYPLVISTLIPGETEIQLFLLTVGLPGYFEEVGETPLEVEYYNLGPFTRMEVPIAFWVNHKEMETIDHQVAELFEPDQRVQFVAMGYRGPLNAFTSDFKLLPKTTCKSPFLWSDPPPVVTIPAQVLAWSLPFPGVGPEDLVGSDLEIFFYAPYGARSITISQGESVPLCITADRGLLGWQTIKIAELHSDRRWRFFYARFRFYELRKPNLDATIMAYGDTLGAHTFIAWVDTDGNGVVDPGELTLPWVTMVVRP